MVGEIIKITLEKSQPINVLLIKESFNFSFTEIPLINITIEGGLKGESGHIHSNKEILDSIYFDNQLKNFLIIGE